MACTGFRPAPSFGHATRCGQACLADPHLLGLLARVQRVWAQVFAYFRYYIPNLFRSPSPPPPGTTGDCGCSLQCTPSTRSSTTALWLYTVVRMSCIWTLCGLYVAIYESCALYVSCMHIYGPYTHCIWSAWRKRVTRPSPPWAVYRSAHGLHMGCVCAVCGCM